MNVPLRELHLFAGAGGGILGGMLLGHTPVCAVELEEYPRNVLLQRQRDGILPWFPIWDDVCTFDGKPWRGLVDVVCGGFPCTDISIAGKGAGITGEHSGLWSEMARIIGEVQPRFVFVENSPMLTVRGLDRVLYNLASMGYDAEWGVIGAHHVGAPHKRDRIWILAYSDSYEYCPDRIPQAETNHVSGKHRKEGYSGRISRTSNGSRVLANTNTERKQQFPEGWNEERNWPEYGSENVADSNMQHGFRRPESQFTAGGSWETRDQFTRCSVEAMADSDSVGGNGKESSAIESERLREMHTFPINAPSASPSWWDTDPGDVPESGLGLLVDGVASELDFIGDIIKGEME